MTSVASTSPVRTATTYTVLFAVTAGHFINDTMQALLMAIYPLLHEVLHLSFAQVGLITFVFQVTASVLQPLIGLFTDKKPLPYSLPFAPAMTMTGLILLGWIRERRIILSWPAVCAPLLLLPCALQNKVVNNTKWMWELKADQESRFSISYLDKNLRDAVGYLCNTSSTYSNSLILTGLGLLGLAWVAWRLVRHLRPARNWHCERK